VDRLLSDNHNLHEQLTEFQNKNNQLLEANFNLLINKSFIQSQIENLSQQVSVFQSQNESLFQQASLFQSQIEVLSQQVSLFQSEKEILSQTNLKYQNHFSGLYLNLNDLTNSNSQLKSDNQNLTHFFETLKNQLNAFKTDSS
jgi:chromosome segregation ATPase